MKTLFVRVAYTQSIEPMENVTWRTSSSTAGLDRTDCRRAIGKWLNEEQNCEVDRTSLAELCAEHDRLRAEEEDLAQMVGRLAGALRKVAPKHDLPPLALNYLQRNGLCGSPLRLEVDDEKLVTDYDAARDCREALFARGLEIADKAMTELVMTHAIRADEHGVVWALVDADGGDIATLYEADTPLIEAVEWLTQRGICELVENQHGAIVVLVSEIGEATL